MQALPRHRFSRLLAMLRRGDWDGLASAVRLNQQVEGRWVRNLLRLGARLASLMPAAWLFRPRRVICQALLTSKHTAWCDTLAPVRQDFHTVLFRSEACRGDATADLGWSARCSSVDIVRVGGDHRTMFDRPQRQELSARFVGTVLDAYASTANTVASDAQRAKRAA